MLKRGQLVKLRAGGQFGIEATAHRCGLDLEDLQEIFGDAYDGTARITHIEGGPIITPRTHITLDEGYWMYAGDLKSAGPAPKEKPSAWAARWKTLMEV